MFFRFPYVSIDVETTGIDRQKSHVLQLAAIYDNGKDLEDLPTFDAVIKWPIISHAEEYAMNLNKALLARAFKGDNVVSIIEARYNFEGWLYSVQPSGRFTAAGKNVQGFDMPILTNPVNNFNLRRFLHRALDPGSMYTEEFNHIPTLNEINTVIGRKPVTHNALDDCWDVVHAIRHKWL
jgi:oligoribonuclease (3'-5' exoribonuclease)